MGERREGRGQRGGGLARLNAALLYRRRLSRAPLSHARNRMGGAGAGQQPCPASDFRLCRLPTQQARTVFDKR